MRRLMSALILGLLAGCSSTSGSSGALSKDLAKQTAGPATLAAFRELCGTPSAEIDRYQEAYIRFAKNKDKISDAEEKKIRSMFAYSRGGMAERFPTPQSVHEQCTKYPGDPTVIDKGIAGNFTGQI